MSGPAIDIDLSIGGVALCPPGSGVAPRTIPDFELVWIMEGDATWICDGATYPAPADTVILVQPGMRDAFRWDPVRPSRVVYLHFDFRAGLEALPPRASWPRLARIDRDDVTQPLFRQIVRLSEEQPSGWESVAHGAATHLLHSFVTRTHETGPDSAFDVPPTVERALLHVRREWAARERCDRISLAALSEAAAISPRQLTRLFQETFGASPIETLRLARLEIAKDLVRHTDLGLDQIAHHTGFANAFHLSRAFKTVHGVPPGAFRSTSAPRAPRSGPSAQARRLVGKLLPRSLV